MANFCGYCGAPVNPDGTCTVCGRKSPDPFSTAPAPEADEDATGLLSPEEMPDFYVENAPAGQPLFETKDPTAYPAPPAWSNAPAYPQPRYADAPAPDQKTAKPKKPGSKKGLKIALIVLGAVLLIALTVFLLDRFGVIDLFGNGNKVGEIYFHATEKAHVKKDEASDFYYADNELLVVARTGVKKRDMETVAKKHNAAVVGFIEVTGDYQLQFETPMTPAQLATEAAALTAEPQVETAAMNLVIPITKAPTAPERPASDDGADPYWDMQLIYAPDAWRVANENKTEFSPVGIGLIENGNPLHADIPVAKSFFDGTGADSHAVAVAAIMAADGTNADGYSGVYPYAKNNLYVASAEGMADAGVSVMWEKAALAQLLASGAKVVNCGYGANEDLDLTAAADTLGDFLNRMLGAGYDFLLVTDAGNTGSAVSYSTLNALPAAKYPQVAARVLTVGASDENGAPLSGVDGGVQLLAPGGNAGSGIYTASANGGFAFVGSDTAYGAPHASGAAALVWSADNNLTGEAVKNLLLSTRQSDRLLDVAAALQAALAGKGGTPALTPAEEGTAAPDEPTPAMSADDWYLYEKHFHYESGPDATSRYNEKGELIYSDNLDGSTSMTFDDLGRLVYADSSGYETPHGFTYEDDADGSHGTSAYDSLQSAEHITETRYYNKAGQLEKKEITSVTPDGMTDHTVHTYSYYPSGVLQKEVSKNEYGETYEEIEYDEEYHLIVRQVFYDSEWISRFRNGVILEKEEYRNGVPTSKVLITEESDAQILSKETIASAFDQAEYTYLLDENGRITERQNRSGTYVTRYEYDEYGHLIREQSATGGDYITYTWKRRGQAQTTEAPTTEAPTTAAPTTEAPAPAADATGDYTQPVRDFLRVLRQQNLESVYMLFSRYTREASPDGAVLMTLLLAIASESPELQNETAELRIVEERDFTDAEFNELLEDDPNGIYHLTAAKHLMVDVVVDGVPKNDPADFMVVKEDGEWKLLMVDLF